MTAYEFINTYLEIPQELSSFEESLNAEDNIDSVAYDFFLNYGYNQDESELQNWLENLQGHSSIRTHEAMMATLDYANLILLRVADCDDDKNLMLAMIYQEYHRQLLTSYKDIIICRYLVKYSIDGELNKELTDNKYFQAMDLIRLLDSGKLDSFQTLEDSQEVLKSLPMYL